MELAGIFGDQGAREGVQYAWVGVRYHHWLGLAKCDASMVRLFLCGEGDLFSMH